MEPMMMSSQQYNQYYQQQPLPPPPPPHRPYNGYEDRRRIASPLPPELPAKPPKKNILKSPLKALKNAIIKSTKPLRRQISLAEPERRLKPILKRQHSMMEQRSARPEIMSYEQHYYNQQQQYYYTQPRQHHYQYERHEPYHPKDPNSTYQNLETESIYGNCGPNYYDQENLYANRALIELERHQPMQVPGSTSTGGRRIVRRHSMADRSAPSPSFSSINRRRGGSSRYTGNVDRNVSIEEPIYQSKNGSYMMDISEHNRKTDEQIYQSRRDMHRDHLYQSRKEMQERIERGKMEASRGRSESPGYSSNSSTSKEPIYQSRKDAKNARSQLRDIIYQSRKEADSMAEPIPKRELKHEPIYESKNENDVIDASLDMSKLQISEVNNLNPNIAEEDPIHSVPEVDTTKIQIANIEAEEPKIHNAPLAVLDDDDEDDVTDDNTLVENNESDIQKAINAAANRVLTTTPLSTRNMHISNFLKRTAPVPPPLDVTAETNDSKEVYASRTSIETHYTSQASLPVGPPNAQSTPFTSQMSIGLPPPRQPITKRGIFDENGGTLLDPVWNVSLVIPPGAIPTGIKQEIYFTVTDPRLSESVGGPPLDMENGWLCIFY